MEYWQLLLLQLIPLLGYLYYYLQKKNSYWSARGVKSPPALPLLGNILELNRRGQVVVEKEWRAKYGKIYGIYMLTEPVLTICDAELTKQVLVKDFHVFVNRDKSPVDHEIWNCSLFNSEDEQWKRIRAITSPSFTTGKLKGMHAMMNQCVNKLGDYFDKVIKTNDGKMNIKEIITGFTIDVIATTAFATETNANGSEKREKNAFLENGIKLFELSLLRFMSVILLPKRFNHWIGNSMGLSDERFNFFRDLSFEIIRQRKQDAGKVKRNDLVQLMLDAFVYENDLKNTSYDKLTANDENDVSHQKQESSNAANGSVKKSLTTNEIIAQCILFFAAGFETTASTLANALYNLAINPEIQDRFAEELNQSLAGLTEDSNEYYEVVMNKIPLLDAVIKETLRMAPPVTRLQRRVGVDGYKLAGIPLDKDVEVDIGTLAVHFDEEFYPEPDKFNPDRFMPENKHLLVPYTYLPFGAGPRNCIGMRFAYQEMKLMLAKIIRSYQFGPTSETKIPLDFSKFGVMTSKNIPLRVSKRN